MINLSSEVIRPYFTDDVARISPPRIFFIAKSDQHNMNEDPQALYLKENMFSPRMEQECRFINFVISNGNIEQSIKIEVFWVVDSINANRFSS